MNNLDPLEAEIHCSQCGRLCVQQFIFVSLVMKTGRPKNRQGQFTNKSPKVIHFCSVKCEKNYFNDKTHHEEDWDVI